MAPRLRLLAALLAATIPACASTPTLPEGEGRGLVSWDRVPPEGAEVFQRPDWIVGDRFIFRRGEDIRISFRVEQADEEGVLLVEEESGLQHQLDAELGDRGQVLPERPEAQLVFDPADSTFSFPLWEGKRWTCHFLSKRPGADAPVPLLVSYHCDAIEQVTVPAGSFRCLRVWRRARVAAKGEYKELTSLFWYAPEVGYVVKRLNANELTELSQYHRQQP